MKLPAGAVDKAIKFSEVHYDNEYTIPRVAATAHLIEMLRSHVILG